MLIAYGDRPQAAVPEFRPPVAEERVVEATGRGWQDWFEILARRATRCRQPASVPRERIDSRAFLVAPTPDQILAEIAVTPG